MSISAFEEQRQHQGKLHPVLRDRFEQAKRPFDFDAITCLESCEPKQQVSKFEFLKQSTIGRGLSIDHGGGELHAPQQNTLDVLRFIIQEQLRRTEPWRRTQQLSALEIGKKPILELGRTHSKLCGHLCEQLCSLKGRSVSQRGATLRRARKQHATRGDRIN